MDESNLGGLRVSIITVVRNGADHIRQTIESVLSQTYPEIEYIIIDGLSTDGTVEIIRSYSDRLAFWKSESDAGIADAFNKGLEHATGSYIQFLNADDLLAGPEVVQQIVQEIHAHNYPALLYGDIALIDRDSARVVQKLRLPFTEKGFLRGRSLPHPALFTHRKYFEKYGNFDNRFRIAMDYDWMLRGIFNERVVQVRILVSLFRLGGISTTHQRLSRDEVVIALKKNKFIVSKAQELGLRAYFLIRLCIKNMAEFFGASRL